MLDASSQEWWYEACINRWLLTIAVLLEGSLALLHLHDSINYHDVHSPINLFEISVYAFYLCFTSWEVIQRAADPWNNFYVTRHKYGRVPLKYWVVASRTWPMHRKLIIGQTNSYTLKHHMDAHTVHSVHMRMFLHRSFAHPRKLSIKTRRILYSIPAERSCAIQSCRLKLLANSLSWKTRKNIDHLSYLLFSETA